MTTESKLIPILDLRPQYETLRAEIQEAVNRVLESGQFIMGPEVMAFEAEAAQYLGARHAVGVNSGTDALFISLRALGIGPGDEVITTPFTFFATAEAISHVGATPIFVDIDERTFNINPELIEEKITPHTRAILPVHLFGQAAEMTSITALAEKYGLKILEDVAQAFGGEYQGRKLGAIGDAGTFSFFPSKNLGAYGDGGLIATNDDGVAEVARMLRVHGAKNKYHNEMIGYNSRLDALQAAILRVKLPHLDRWNAERRQVAEHYNKLLGGLPDTSTPFEAAYAKHVYHQYTVRLANGKRDEARERLAEARISTMIYFPVPMHRLPVYAELNDHLPVAEAAADEVLSLPIWPQMPRAVQEWVTEALRGVLA
jgi:dTDP-4-amino-4,6-dideoxygalactose transaminase